MTTRCGSCGLHKMILSGIQWSCPCGWSVANRRSAIAKAPEPRPKAKPPEEESPMLPSAVTLAKSAAPLPVETIISAVCRACLIDESCFFGASRHHRATLARELVVLIARRRTLLSYPELTQRMCRPNHSTVITAHRRAKRKIDVPRPVARYWGYGQSDRGPTGSYGEFAAAVEASMEPTQ